MARLGRSGDQGYRAYLRSAAWRRRREAWIAGHVDEWATVPCAVCLIRLSAREVDLHHLDYSGVVELAGGRWEARERDDDLVAMCRLHHDELHQLLDRDRGWSLMSRREASRQVIGRLRAALAARVARYLGKPEESEEQ